MNNTFTKVDESKLIEAFLIWFWDNKEEMKSNKNFWYKNKLGIEIRKAMQDAERWKELPRGNPKKAYQAMKRTESMPSDLDF